LIFTVFTQISSCIIQVSVNKYTNTTPFYNLYTVCSTKSVAININLFEFKLFEDSLET